MDVGKMQLSELQHTVNLSLLQKTMATGASQVINMLNDFKESQPQKMAPHPTLGKNIDVYA